MTANTVTGTSFPDWCDQFLRQVLEMQRSNSSGRGVGLQEIGLSLFGSEFDLYKTSNQRDAILQATYFWQSEGILESPEQASVLIPRQWRGQASDPTQLRSLFDSHEALDVEESEVLTSINRHSENRLLGHALLEMVEYETIAGQPECDHECRRKLDSIVGNLVRLGLAKRTHIMSDFAAQATYRGLIWTSQPSVIDIGGNGSRFVMCEPIWQSRELTTDDRLCFVIMPFAKEFRRTYDELIRPVVESKGLVCLRADEIHGPAVVTEDVWIKTYAARLLIADISRRNANVFYELGVAHTIGKPVILLAQSDETIPFDVQHYRAIKYDIAEPGSLITVDHLSKSIDSVIHG